MHRSHTDLLRARYNTMNQYACAALVLALVLIIALYARRAQPMTNEERYAAWRQGLSRWRFGPVPKNEPEPTPAPTGFTHEAEWGEQRRLAQLALLEPVDNTFG